MWPQGVPTPLCATVQIRAFLGAAGFCHIWISNYSLLAKSLYEATKGGKWKPTVWGDEQKMPLKKLRGHSQIPCSGMARCDENLLPICTWKSGDSCRSLDPAAKFLAPPGGLYIKATWYNFLSLATLPEHPLLLSWWLKHMNLLWDKNSQSEFSTLCWFSWNIRKIIG
jgi:hypothetical protein